MSGWTDKHVCARTPTALQEVIQLDSCQRPTPAQPSALVHALDELLSAVLISHPEALVTLPSLFLQQPAQQGEEMKAAAFRGSVYVPADYFNIGAQMMIQHRAESQSEGEIFEIVDKLVEVHEQQTIKLGQSMTASYRHMRENPGHVLWEIEATGRKVGSGGIDIHDVCWLGF